MRILIAGTGRLGTNLLKAIISSKHQVVGILQNGRENKGIKRYLTPLLLGIIGGEDSIIRQAKKHRIPILWIDKMTDTELAPIRKLDPDLILTGGFSIIFKKPILTLPRVGCVNVHSSLLPKHRGPNPFYAVIRQGETVSGVTFHIMDEGIDTGPIIAQQSFPITDTDTAYTVYCRACELAKDMVIPVLDKIEREGLHGTPQDHSLATYDPKPTVKDAIIRWDVPAYEIDRQVRALALTILPRFKYKNKTVYVSKVKVNLQDVSAPPGTVIRPRYPAEIATAKGTVILQSAFTTFPILYPWPPTKNTLHPGQILQ